MFGSPHRMETGKRVSCLNRPGAGKMVQQVEVLVTQEFDLSLTPRTHVRVEEANECH